MLMSIFGKPLGKEEGWLPGERTRDRGLGVIKPPENLRRRRGFGELLGRGACADVGRSGPDVCVCVTS